MSDEATDPLDAHRATVREFSRPDGPLDPTGPHATTANPRWFFGGDVERPTPERDRLHQRLLDQARAAHPEVRHERRAIVLAGPPGAGKSTVLNEDLQLDKGAWLSIDADEFKAALLAESVADGSYETFLTPPEVKDRAAAGEPFYPMELAALVHEESSYLAKTMRRQALAEGTNVVIDQVMSSPSKALALGRQLAKAEYDVQLIDVEVPFEVSEARIASRWRQSYEQALTTGRGLGGRWVPSSYAREVFDPATGRSRSQEAAHGLAQTCPVVSRYRRFWTAAADAPRTVEVDQSRRSAGGPLLDTAVLSAATRGQGTRPPGPRTPHRSAPSGPER